MEKLTPDEAAFAKAHLDTVDRFLARHRLDPAEWYDVVIFEYLRAAQYAYRNLPPEETEHARAILIRGMEFAFSREYEAQMRPCRNNGIAPLSLDAVYADTDSGEASLYDLIPAPDDTEAAVMDRDLIERCLAAATPRQREMLRLTYLGFNRDQIGAMSGITPESVRNMLYGLRDRVRAVRDDRPVQKCPACQMRYKEKTREKHRANAKAYREAHKEELRARRKAYREAHREEIRAYKKAYNEAHREENRAYTRAWRLRKKAAADGANISGG